MDFVLPAGVVFLAVLFALLLVSRTVVIVKQASTAIVERLAVERRAREAAAAPMVPAAARPL